MQIFLDKSDVYTAKLIFELLPEDFLFKENAILLVRMKKYRKAFDIAARTLNEMEFCERLAELAV